MSLGIFTLVGVIMLVLSGASFGYLLRLQHKSPSSWMLLFFFLSVALSSIATFLTNSGTVWERAFAPAQDSLLFLGSVFLVRFAYIYPVNDQPAEARRVTGFFAVLALAVLGYSLFFALRYFAGLPEGIEESQLYYLITPVALFLLVLIFFRRSQHLSAQPMRASSLDMKATAPSLRTLLRPANPPALALRNFGLALSLGLIPLITMVTKAALPPLLASFFFNFGVVIAIAAIMLVYLNHAPEPTTLNARLIGISLVFVMLILGLASVWFVLGPFRSQVHETVLIFIALVLLSSLLIIIFFPLFFRATLLNPLGRLLGGVRAANSGNLEVQIDVQYEDEVGFLTHSFNRMVASLNKAARSLEDRSLLLEQEVVERTEELRAINVQLIRENQERKGVEARLDRQLSYERALLQCSQILAVPVKEEADRREVFRQAMAPLLEVTRASRVGLFQNLEDPQFGPSFIYQAEVCAPGIPERMGDLGKIHFPWSAFPAPALRKMQIGENYGGLVKQVFASSPEILAHNDTLSAQFVPIHTADHWWGLIAIDDCHEPRRWYEQEITFLSTAAELFASAIQRWQSIDSLERQMRFQGALARFSQVMLRQPENEAQRIDILNQALAHLIPIAEVGRAYVFRNFQDPVDGDCMGMLAEACAPGVNPHILNPANRKMKWSFLPEDAYNTLAANRVFGGPTDQLFVDAPELLAAFQSQNPPLLSVLLIPLFFGDHWWGFIGFDDVVQARRWDQEEILLLRTASEIAGNTLQRWEAESQLNETLDGLELRVEQRTAELQQVNAMLVDEIQVRRRTQDNLENRLKVEEQLAHISVRLQELNHAGQSVMDSLRDLGQIMDAGRTYLVELEPHDSTRAREFFEWYRPELEPLSRELIHSVLESLNWVQDRLQAGEAIYIEDTSLLPDEAGLEKQMMQARGIRSLVLAPLLVDHNLRGILGCSNLDVSRRSVRANLRAFELVAGMLNNRLEREHLIQNLEEQVAERTRQLTTFFDMAMLSGESQDLTEILQPTLAAVTGIVFCDASSIHLIDEDSSCLHLTAQRGMPSSFVDSFTRIEFDAGFKEWLYNAAYPQDGCEQTPFPDPFCLPTYRSFIAARLRAGGQVLGVLCCYRVADEPFSPFQATILTALGELLGIIVENYRLRIEAEELAVIEERQRLARDIHDAVSQSVYSLSLFARSARDALDEGSQRKLESNLQDLEVTSIQALREMRLLLYQLSEPEQQDGIPAALETRFNQLERRLGMRASQEVDPGIIMSPRVRHEVWRIITEALNNIVKHAAAGRVQVRISPVADRLQVLIEDDGVGFDTSCDTPGMGLNNMKLRTSELGGRFEVLSTPGQGTRITLEFPRKSWAAVKDESDVR